jgi:putative membrane protein
MMSSEKYPIVLLIGVLAFLTWSGIEPHGTRLTWVLETLPVMIALPVILLTYKRFPLSRLTHMSLCLIGSIFALILLTKLHNKYLPAIGIE